LSGRQIKNSKSLADFRVKIFSNEKFKNRRNCPLDISKKKGWTVEDFQPPFTLQPGSPLHDTDLISPCVHRHTQTGAAAAAASEGGSESSSACALHFSSFYSFTLANLFHEDVLFDESQ
jgi:hypothetical protein